MVIQPETSNEDYKKIGEMVRTQLLAQDLKEGIAEKDSSVYGMLGVIQFPKELYELKDQTQRVEIVITSVDNN